MKPHLPGCLTGALLWLAASAAPALAAPASAAPALQSPVDCTLGVDCVIQNYVDTDPGPAARDHACGRLSYDGHQGTDFRAQSLAALPRALAAAGGVVIAARDDAPERLLPEDSGGADCGNHVLIDHGAGWVTQYCHMARGGLSVRAGQRVAAGDALGRIGASGSTSFPHLHFAVRHHGIPVDPFTGRGAGAGCGPGRALWAARSGIDYIETAMLGYGLAGEEPTFEKTRRDAGALAPAGAGDRFIYLWAHVFGARAGDVLRFTLVDPSGQMAANETFTLPRDRRIFFANIGVEPADGGWSSWPTGRYSARMVLERGGEPLFERGLAAWLEAAN